MNKPINSELAVLLFKKHGVLFQNISDVVMWLYEKHRIWISSSAIYSPHLRRNDVFFIRINILNREDSDSIEIRNNATKGTSFKSPTEAYEAAIKYCLTELIK